MGGESSNDEKPEIPSGESNPGEKEFSSKEEHFKMHKIALNETALIVAVPIIIDKESIVTALGKIKTSISLLNDEEESFYKFL